MLRHFQTREFAENIHYLHTTPMPKTYQEWESLHKPDQVRFVQLSQEMESIGLLLAERLISIDLLDKTLGTFVSNSWEQFKPVIIDMREKNADPFLNEYFQWMAEQIDRRMKERPRTPFFLSSETAV